MNNYLKISLGAAVLFLSSCESLNTGGFTLPPQGTGTTGTGSTTTPAGTTGGITQSEANLGVKQALSNGLNESIRVLSLKDGFLGDAAVKILMPEEARKVESALRAVGMGNLCDQFITSMNRAAETAVKEASSVFVGSLSRMTVNDAFNILLSGQQDAATQFFKRSTTAELTTRFSPIIQSAMGKNNVSTYWNQLTSAYNKLPLGNKIETDLTAYVTQRAISGLFVKVADQELKIRQNLGGSRNSSILNKVFGWADQQK
ncbi:DUF4197 domain-containing protein [Sphingobacterium hotanense]|uniref:DUF4197 domain-containing protein n=1 Tax=Sphingobacterium hotanense TaxID=649196 RepID=UPI0021A887CD|nr:DUF4197 domain-containing protein [Sphingobacterium hotanense]MCT1527009.1 DUF4197 domain-containing protein [Sphingobacterium hotanense]